MTSTAKTHRRCTLLVLCMTLALLLAGCGEANREASSGEVSAGSSAAFGQAAESAQTEAQQPEAQAESGTAAGQSQPDPAETDAPAAQEPADLAPAETAGASEPETQLPGLEFPYTLDEGRLVVNSLFPSSIPNPDCGDQEGEDIASLEVVNQSGAYLDSAVFTVTLTDGTALSFEADAIPDGATVWAFERSNTPVAQQASVAEITCTAYYADTDPMLTAAVTMETAGTEVTLTEQSGSSLYGLRVGFHNVMDNVYFGGLAIEYTVEELPAYGSITLDVVECWLGDAAPVYVYAEDESNKE